MRKKPNLSTAVVNRRLDHENKVDFFPTPAWATRALMTHVVRVDVSEMTCLEPACGEGHMVRPLKEFFRQVRGSDVAHYGRNFVADYLCSSYGENEFDWVVTNPPFSLAEQFVHRSRAVARRGVAVLVRTAFVESVGRYERLFRGAPPSVVAAFSERVPLVYGSVDREAGGATSYSWLVWLKKNNRSTRMVWIPPCRAALERDSDYD